MIGHSDQRVSSGGSLVVQLSILMLIALWRVADSSSVQHKQINDRYEFPSKLDLDRENGKYLSPDADRSVRNLYTLHRYFQHPVSATLLMATCNICRYFIQDTKYFTWLNYLSILC